MNEPRPRPPTTRLGPVTTTVFHDGVPWYDMALRAAAKRDLVDRLNDLARAYFDGVRLMHYEDPHGYGRVRVERGGIAVVINPDGIVIGFVTHPAQLRLSPSQRRPGSGKGRRRGPTSWVELETWLTEGGFRVVVSEGHKAVLDWEGNRIGTLPSTPSDHRALPNSTAELRRLTGLDLRR